MQYPIENSRPRGAFRLRVLLSIPLRAAYFMIMEFRMTEIKYVQLESGDFLADPDFQLMTSSERGIYCSVIFYMYLNDGKILNDPSRIKILTNSDESFEISWKVVEKKFVEKNGYLTHKRVRKELAKAKKFIQRQRKAGLASAAARQPRLNGGSTTVQPAMQPNKVKESKRKESKTKRFIVPTLQEISSYISEKKYSVDPKKFLEWYDTAEWKDVNGKPVQNWKLKIVSWHNHNESEQPPIVDRGCFRCAANATHYALDDAQQKYYACAEHKHKGMNPI